MSRRPDSSQKLTKAYVRYRPGSPARHCGNCVMFTLLSARRSEGKCDLVLGVIQEEKVCDRWEARTGRAAGA